MDTALFEQALKNIQLYQQLDPLLIRICNKFGPALYNESYVTTNLNVLIKDDESQKQLLRVIEKVNPLLKKITIDFEQITKLKLKEPIHKAHLIYLIIKNKYYSLDGNSDGHKLNLKKFADKILFEDKELLKRLS